VTITDPYAYTDVSTYFRTLVETPWGLIPVWSVYVAAGIVGSAANRFIFLCRAVVRNRKECIKLVSQSLVYVIISGAIAFFVGLELKKILLTMVLCALWPSFIGDLSNVRKVVAFIHDKLNSEED